MGPTATERVNWLRQAVAEGKIHTVRLSFGDHLGAWRGKRIPAQHFLAHHLEAPMGFCDGMIVCDVGCDIIQETPFSNFTTGYPDFYVWPDLARLREAAWAPGEAYVFGVPADDQGSPAATGPTQVLERVVRRFADRGLDVAVRARLGGRFMSDGRIGASWGVGGLSPAESTGPLNIVIHGLIEAEIPVGAVTAGPAGGEFEIEFTSGEPRDIADAVLITKGACKEVGAANASRPTFMTRTVDGSRPSLQTFDVRLAGADREVDPERISGLFNQMRGASQPSITAFKAGLSPEPMIEFDDEWTTVRSLIASAEADPFVAVAASLAAVAESIASPSTPLLAPPRSLMEAADVLRDSEWISEWLGPDYVSNTIPLLEHESAMFDDVVSDWEIQRYWGPS